MNTATLTTKVNMWLHEHLAMKTPAKLLGGLALGALVMAATALPLGTTYADEPARPFSSGQNPGYCEIDGSCYDPPLLGVLPNPALVAGSPLASEQFEYWPEVGFDSYTYHRFMVEQGKVGRRISREQAATVIDRYDRGLFDEIPAAAVEYWPEVGLDSHTYHQFMLNQGKKVYAEIDDVEAMVIYGYPASIFHALNEGKVGRLLSSTKTKCYPELQIC